MKGTLDEFLEAAPQKGPGERRRKKKRLKSTSLESFLPKEYVNYFRELRIGSKKIRNARVEL